MCSRKTYIEREFREESLLPSLSPTEQTGDHTLTDVISVRVVLHSLHPAKLSNFFTPANLLQNNPIVINVITNGMYFALTLRSSTNTRKIDMHRKSNALKILAVHILGLGSLATLPAHATVITNTLTVNGQASADAVINPFGPSTDPAYISEYIWTNGSDGSYSQANAWGNQYGTYYAGASGNGVFDSFGRFHRTVELTNDNGYATDYSLNFFIYYGSMSANAYGVAGAGWGSYDLSITKTVASVTDTLFSSGATIHSDGNLEERGTQLDGAMQFGNYYYWNGTYVTLDLGTLADGDSLSIDFDLVSTAFGDFAFSDSCNGGDDGYGGVDDGYGGDIMPTSFENGYGGCTGSVYVGLGDPGDFAENGQQNPSVSITGTRTPTQVPLPGTLALLGIGLAGLGFARKTLSR